MLTLVIDQADIAQFLPFGKCVFCKEAYYPEIYAFAATMLAKTRPMKHADFMKMAIELSRSGMNANEGGPFGAIVVKDDKVIGRGNNKVTSSCDPTAHAEVVAIRDACTTLGSFQLDGCTLYTSCEPCPMCLGAIYWARPDKVFYANTKQDAADIDFDDDFIYKEIELPLQSRKIPFVQLGREDAQSVFKAWRDKADKLGY
jgi:tRNA(Arg) A34 adenosine deaminase TadA